MTYRTLFLHVSPGVPQPLAHGSWAPGTIAPGGKIVLSQSNLTALYSGTSTGFAGVIGSIVMSAGAWYWETQSRNTTVSNQAYTGIIAAGQAANGGSASTLCTANSGTGQFTFGGSNTANVGQTTNGARVAHWLDMDEGVYRVGKAGAWQVAASGLKASGYYPVMQAQVDAYGWSLCTGSIVVPGLSPLQWTPPSGAKLYATQPAAVPTLQRLASRHFTAPGFLLGPVPEPLSYYDGRIAITSDVRISQSITMPQWGSGESTTAFGTIDLWNGDGGLDAWKAYDWRDKTIQLAYTEGVLPGALVDGLRYATATVDDIQYRGDMVRIVLRGQLVRLRKPVMPTSYKRQADAGQHLQRALTDIGEDNEGRPLPFLIGKAFQAEPFNVNADPLIREYQIADAPVTSLVAYDRGDPFIETLAGPDITRTSQGDGFRMWALIAGPDGKVTCDVTGPATRGAQRITLANGGAFTTWAGSPTTPNGWTRFGTENANCQFLNASSALRIRSDGSTSIGLAFTGVANSFTANAMVECQFNVTAVTTPGPVYLRLAQGLSVSNVRVQVTGTGLYRVIIPPTGGTSLGTVSIVSGSTAAQTTDVTIDNFQAWEITPIVALGDVLQHLIVTRGGFSSGDLEIGTFNDFQAADPSPLGYYTDQQTNINEIVKDVVDSVGGFVCEDRFGKIRVSRFGLKNTATPVLTLTKDDIIGDVDCELDTAPNLSTIFAAMRNYSPSDPSSLAGSVSAADRRRWSQAFQVVRSALGLVHPTYAHADNAKAFPTLHATSDGAKAAASRSATWYAEERHFYRVTVLLDLAVSITLNCGDAIRLIVPRYDLAAGRTLLLCSLSRSFWPQAVDLVLWG